MLFNVDAGSVTYFTYDRATKTGRLLFSARHALADLAPTEATRWYATALAAGDASTAEPERAALMVQLGEAHVGIPRAGPALGAIHAVGVEQVERGQHHRVVQRVHRPTVDLVVGPECRQVLVEAPLEGTMIVICNNDQPGVIGEVGTILGRHRVNIANFALGRDGERAVGVVNVDETAPIPEAVLKEVLNVPAIREVRLVRI